MRFLSHNLRAETLTLTKAGIKMLRIAQRKIMLRIAQEEMGRSILGIKLADGVENTEKKEKDKNTRHHRKNHQIEITLHTSCSEAER